MVPLPWFRIFLGASALKNNISLRFATISCGLFYIRDTFIIPLLYTYTITLNHYIKFQLISSTHCLLRPLL